MKATDLPLLIAVSRPSIHPDLSRAVVSVTHPDLDADAYVGQLFSVDLAGGRPAARITRGRRDTAPRFSPDGALLAFLRDSGDGPAQLHVAPSGGGESVRVTDALLGVGDFRWSPEGTRIAFTSRVPEPGRYGTVDGLGAGAEPPRLITTQKFRSNGVGYTGDRRTHVFLVEVPDPAAEPAYPAAASVGAPADAKGAGVPPARQLTSGDVEHGAIAFSPDGDSLAVVAARHPSRDDDLITDIHTIDLTRPDAEPSPAPGRGRSPGSEALGIGVVEWAADGTLYFLATELGESGRDFVGRGTSLFALTVGGEARRLTDPTVHDLGEVGSALSLVDGGVIVQNRIRGRVELLRVGADGRSSTVDTGDVAVTGHDAVAGTIVASFASPRSAGELGVIEDGRLRQLTVFSGPLEAAGIAPSTELEIAARDGHPVHGWVLEPDGEGPHPVLLTIHGGPFAQYGVALSDEAQVYVDAGYAVVMCNPRGSAGYGEDHARAIRHRLGTLDYTDVLDFLDGALAERGSLDPDRVGIMGGSYGGYLTAWTIAHEHRFVAAVVERGFLDPEQFVGTSDIGSFFSDEYVGLDEALVRAQSPQAVVNRVRTPTLVVHSADDLRCPLSQGERYFAALMRQGTPAELLVFPGENHELTRSGRPRHRRQRFDAILHWWARHLPTDRNPEGERP